ncbi:unnamed protein product [Psylliodes chrysocephalus]|uniref:Regulatory protein zeste n=1 Tax=Psylliodes chrysocephalus TaxID=3402493 RepID=A0A9P0CW33_9CUCU|nr:unnamed protein product [Psylliodes chrysocephala]
MDNVKNKTTRAPNFSTREKHVLFDIISKYKDIIENKKTDASSTSDKLKAWARNSLEFNSVSPNFVSRPILSLKKFYENKKKEVRKQVAEERKEVLLTGGGSLPQISKDSDQEKLLGIMNPDTVFGINTPFGSDAYLIPNTVDNEENDTPKVQDHEDIVIKTHEDPNNEISESIPWKKYKASDLATPITSCLKTPNKQNTSRRRPATVVRALTSSTLAEKYERLVDMSLSIAQMELTKMKNYETFNSLKLENLKLDIEIRKRKTEITPKI